MAIKHVDKKYDDGNCARRGISASLGKQIQSNEGESLAADG